MSPRVGFFVDGFNLYHSVTKVAQETSDESVKWLDLQGLARGILPLISPSASLASIHYFTALPEHLYLADPGRLQRHRLNTGSGRCWLGADTKSTVLARI